MRYGGNTSCVQVHLSDGSHVVLDAGTGIRNVDLQLDGSHDHIHLLLTHLHLDHIQGLLFFTPLFQAEARSRSGARRRGGCRCRTGSAAISRRR